eukprot:scaffold667495_cov92-Prasinocladus_malaysianus.AAC.1
MPNAAHPVGQLVTQDLGPGTMQQGDHLHMAIGHGFLEGRGPTAVPGVDIGSTGDEALHHLLMALAGGKVQWGPQIEVLCVHHKSQWQERQGQHDGTGNRQIR